MPGNDLSALTALIPSATTRQDSARANVSTILTGIINDIEPKVTPAGLDMSTALSFLSGGTYQEITNLDFLNMFARTGTPGTDRSVYVNADDLYYVDGNSNAIQLTSGGAIVGGAGSITGAGYGSAGVEVAWVSGTADYRMKSGSGANDYADVIAEKVQYSDTAGKFCTLASPAGLAATLAYVFPSTHPASTSAVTLTSSGGLGHTRDLSLDTITLTGDYNHGDKVLCINAGMCGWLRSGGSVDPVYNSDGGLDSTSGTPDYIIPIPLLVGDRVKSIRISGDWGSGAAKTIRYKTHTMGVSGSTDVTNTTWTDAGWTDTVWNLADQTITANIVPFLLLEGVAPDDDFYAVQITYDHP